MKCELCGKECIRTSVVKRCPECLLVPVVVKEPEVIEEVIEVPIAKIKKVPSKKSKKKY